MDHSFTHNSSRRLPLLFKLPIETRRKQFKIEKQNNVRFLLAFLRLLLILNCACSSLVDGHNREVISSVLTHVSRSSIFFFSSFSLSVSVLFCFFTPPARHSLTTYISCFSNDEASRQRARKTEQRKKTLLVIAHPQEKRLSRRKFSHKKNFIRLVYFRFCFCLVFLWITMKNMSSINENNYASLVILRGRKKIEKSKQMIETD